MRSGAHQKMKFRNNEQFYKLFIPFGVSVISMLSRPNLSGTLPTY